jgi:CheY-like chemotaxis protein
MFSGTPIPPVHRPFVQLIEDNGQYLVGLINDILDLSKIEAGKFDLHCSSVDLVSAMRNVVAITIGLLKDKPVQICQDFDDTLPRVWADPMRLRQICLNLMSNAIKFTAIGSITLKASVEGEFVRIAVIDTGIGIPEKALATIFDRFEQAQHGTDRQYGGTGLGLDISKQLSIMHGGELTVQSIVGQGSTFSFTIPIAITTEDDFPLPDDMIDDGVELFDRATKIDDVATILLVEDEASTREWFHLALENAGYVVVDTHDGEKVMALAIGLLPTLIVLDIHLPNLINWTLLAKLKDNPDTSTVPVIVCTNDPQSANLLDSAFCLQTPTTAEALLRVIRLAIPR